MQMLRREVSTRLKQLTASRHADVISDVFISASRLSVDPGLPAFFFCMVFTAGQQLSSRDI